MNESDGPNEALADDLELSEVSSLSRAVVDAVRRLPMQLIPAYVYRISDDS